MCHYVLASIKNALCSWHRVLYDMGLQLIITLTHTLVDFAIQLYFLKKRRAGEAIQKIQRFLTIATLSFLHTSVVARNGAERSDEAIQCFLTVGTLDCFAVLPSAQKLSTLWILFVPQRYLSKSCESVLTLSHAETIVLCCCWKGVRNYTQKLCTKQKLLRKNKASKLIE